MQAMNDGDQVLGRVGVEGLLFKEECYQIMGCCFEVYKEMGCGFLEAVYHECLTLAFQARGVPFQSKPKLTIQFGSQVLQQTYEPDFVCYDRIIVEIKAVKELTDIFRAKVHHYLKATSHQLGLLVNFGHHPQVEWERIIRSTAK
jgi:GxxExxY protein